MNWYDTIKEEERCMWESGQVESRGEETRISRKLHTSSTQHNCNCFRVRVRVLVRAHECNATRTRSSCLFCSLTFWFYDSNDDRLRLRLRRAFCFFLFVVLFWAVHAFVYFQRGKITLGTKHNLAHELKSKLNPGAARAPMFSQWKNQSYVLESWRGSERASSDAKQ